MVKAEIILLPLKWFVNICSFFGYEYNFPICAYPVPCVFLFKSLTEDPTLFPLPVPDLNLFFCMCVCDYFNKLIGSSAVLQYVKKQNKTHRCY